MQYKNNTLAIEIKLCTSNYGSTRLESENTRVPRWASAGELNLNLKFLLYSVHLTKHMITIMNISNKLNYTKILPTPIENRKIYILYILKI
jgi:hypothetical protein